MAKNKAQVTTWFSQIDDEEVREDAKKKNIKIRKLDGGFNDRFTTTVRFTGNEKDLVHFLGDWQGYEGETLKQMKDWLESPEEDRGVEFDHSFIKPYKKLQKPSKKFRR